MPAARATSAGRALGSKDAPTPELVTHTCFSVPQISFHVVHEPAFNRLIAKKIGFAAFISANKKP